MQVIYSGAAYHNKKGCFSKRLSRNLYGIFYFYTPFVYEKNGRFIRGEAGDLLLSEPNEIVCHGPVSDDESFVNDWMYVSTDFSVVLKKYPIPYSENISIGKNNITNFAIRAIKDEQIKGSIGCEDKIDCILTEMLIELHRTYINFNNENGKTIIETVHNQIMQAPNQNWTLQEMANLSGYSPSRFSALYLKHYGCSPKQALLKKRLDMAEQLLAYNQLSIKEIAEKCGFQSIYYFSKYFKKHNGIPPSNYTKNRT